MVLQVRISSSSSSVVVCVFLITCCIDTYINIYTSIHIYIYIYEYVCVYIYICLSTCHPAVLCRLLQVARASRGQARRSLPTAPVSICTFVLAKQEKQVNRIAVLSFQLYCLCRLPHLTCQYVYFCTSKASKASKPHRSTHFFPTLSPPSSAPPHLSVFVLFVLVKPVKRVCRTIHPRSLAIPSASVTDKTISAASSCSREPFTRACTAASAEHDTSRFPHNSNLAYVSIRQHTSAYASMRGEHETSRFPHISNRRPSQRLQQIIGQNTRFRLSILS